MTTHDSPAGAFEIGDHVTYLPRGEPWVVAKVWPDGVSACGWPGYFAWFSEIEFVKRGDPPAVRALIKRLAELRGDSGRFIGWRTLCEGEIIRATDQYYDKDAGAWVSATDPGSAAPSPDCPANRQYRRWEGDQ